MLNRNGAGDSRPSVADINGKSRSETENCRAGKKVYVGLARWLSKERHLPPRLTTRVVSQGPHGVLCSAVQAAAHGTYKCNA